MNLLKDPWLPIVRKDGTKEKIAIHQLLDSYTTNPVMELEAPRPDFKNALYQLLIGIVQVAAMPEDEEDWAEYFETPYSSEEFSQMVLKYEECFEIDSDGPAFMQDFDLPEGEKKSIAALLIESPGESTVDENRDHFVKGGIFEKIDIYWASIALYTMQTFAPSGGPGYRVGLRGGGPLTTMLIPSVASTLWENIWLNITSEEYVSTLQGDLNLNQKADYFPWLKATKTSVPDKTTKVPPSVFSPEVHPFHHFFGMPRRVRFTYELGNGTCDLTNSHSEKLVSHFITKTHGNNYDGAWTHPLNAYSHNPKKPDEFPLSIKAQPGGIGYRHWLGLAIESDRVIPATVVKLARESNYRKGIIKSRGIILWAAGFDMDNMKARCWYESKMPLFSISPTEAIELGTILSVFIKESFEIVKILRKQLKAAWANNSSGDMSFLDTAFWQNTEAPFYEMLRSLISNLEDIEVRNSLVAKWANTLSKEVESLFDANALAQQEEGLNMKRVVKARQGLGKGIGKMIKKLNALKEEV